MGVSRLHTAEVDTLCHSLREVLHRIHEALPALPPELQGELFSEELGRQWLHKYNRVLESLDKSAPSSPAAMINNQTLT